MVVIFDYLMNSDFKNKAIEKTKLLQYNQMYMQI